MDPAEKKRKLIIGAALIATLIAAVLVEEEEDGVMSIIETVQPTRTQGDRTTAHENNSLDISKLGQRTFNPLAGEIFASTTWAPKPKPVSLEEQAEKLAAQHAAKANVRPPVPTAPPLQFKYAGKAIAENGTWIFLSQNGENHIVKIGGKVNDQYRLDSMNDEKITLTYLPLNIKQTLIIQNKTAGSFR